MPPWVRHSRALAALVLALASVPRPARAQSCDGASLFRAPEFTPPGAPQRHATVADVNRDGVPDLVLSTDAVDVRLGSLVAGTLTYGPAIRTLTGARPTGTAIADFDGDGIPDMVVACDGGPLTQFRGLGDGRFARVGTFNPIANMWDVMAVDLNLDGITDLIVTGLNAQFVVLLGTGAGGVGDGGFEFPFDVDSFGHLKGLVVADFDGDGAPDAAFATQDSFIVVHPGLIGATGPSGRFGPPIVLPGPHGPTYDVTAADFDNDGRLDLASADSTGTVTVYLQTAPMQFTTVVSHPIPGSPLGIRAADVNHDGYPDLVVGSAHGGASFWLLVNEAGNSSRHDRLGDPYPFGPDRGTSGIAVADLNHDGLADVVAPSASDAAVAYFTSQCPVAGLGLSLTVHGAGTVTRVPDKLVYAPDDIVTLTASAAPTYQFDGWRTDASGNANPLTVRMDRTRFITAEFPPIVHSLSLDIVGAGSILKSPDAQLYYHEGTTVHLAAKPGIGYFFVRWSGDTTGTADSTAVVMDGDRRVIATFRPDPAVSPLIESIADTPNDQGGSVTLRWRPSRFEFVPQDSGVAVNDYFVWRSRPPVSHPARPHAGEPEPPPCTCPPCPKCPFNTPIDGRNFVWEYLATVPATGLESYSFAAATPTDSGAAGTAYTFYMVQARDVSGTLFWNSPPDSGYAVDNLQPLPPPRLVAALAGGNGVLHWSASPDSDVVGYNVHRGASPDFVPGAGNLLVTTNDTAFVDSHPNGSWYKVAAVDVHGNVGAYALAALFGQAFALEGTVPNPSVGGHCFVQLVLPSDAPARLELLDVSGRSIAVRALKQPGRQSVDLGAGRRLRAGLYWVRLVQGPNVRTARAVLLR